MVSIVMSTYNSIKYIKAQLDSIKNQTFQDYELIITDDDSKDDTVNYIESYILSNHLNNWHLYKEKTNVGYVLNFKRGIAKAEGDIIFLCDHDDVWHSNKLEIMLNVFRKNSAVGLLGSSFTMINGDDEPIMVQSNFLDRFMSNYRLIKYPCKRGKLRKMTYKQVLAYSFTPGCCIAFKKKYKDVIINIINVAPHDYAISLLFALKKECYFFNLSTIDYRLHCSNQIGIKDKNNLEERIALCQKDIDDRIDIICKLKAFMSKSDLNFSKKFLYLLNERKNALITQNKHKLIFILIKSIFYKKYFYSILKDIKSL